MRITCVHQGYELYGSDRSFIDSLRAIRAAYPEAAITVVLPRSGPIVPWLRDLASEIVFEPLWIFRRRGFLHLATLGLLRLPPAILRAARRIGGSDLVYVNTSVIADYMLAARLFRGRVMLHAHELPKGVTRQVLRLLVRWSGAFVIFNSRATEAAFALPEGSDSAVVYNGIAGPGVPEPVSYDGGRPLRLLMLGRISRIKGQEVLLDAVAMLPPSVRDRLEIRIVGSAFEDRARERDLAGRIAATSLGGCVSLMPFVPDPASLYRWADVVVVPSRLPESLGRVAIEAMAYGRPALVSAIGGLREVVEDARTGWVVPPDEPAALAAALGHIVEHPSHWRDYGAAARARYEALFTQAAAADAIQSLVASQLARRGPPRSRAAVRDMVPS